MTCPNCVTPWKCNGPHVPDKPLHERLMACVNPHDEGLIDAPADLLREAAEALRNCGELSRMRTALEEIRALPDVACDQCGAIAERALTAGSDK